MVPLMSNSLAFDAEGEGVGVSAAKEGSELKSMAPKMATVLSKIARAFARDLFSWIKPTSKNRFKAHVAPLLIVYEFRTLVVIEAKN